MCNHGDFRHKIYFHCCNKYFACKYCHYEETEHVDNCYITKIKCNECSHEQLPSRNCKNLNCKINFCNYYCKICPTWSFTKNFHCNECNKCYINVDRPLIHCKICNQCFYDDIFDNHKCDMNKEPLECQICFDEVKSSYKQYYFLKCNHVIHHECYDPYHKMCQEKDNITSCCICRRTMIDPVRYESKFDKLKSMWSVSPSYADKISEVSCNDCLKKSNIPYHPKYNKCSHCRSYNTNFLRSLN